MPYALLVLLARRNLFRARMLADRRRKLLSAEQFTGGEAV
jgi:hypothetical protein